MCLDGRRPTLSAKRSRGREITRLIGADFSSRLDTRRISGATRAVYRTVAASALYRRRIFLRACDQARILDHDPCLLLSCYLTMPEFDTALLSLMGINSVSVARGAAPRIGNLHELRTWLDHLLDLQSSDIRAT